MLISIAFGKLFKAKRIILAFIAALADLILKPIKGERFIAKL